MTATTNAPTGRYFHRAVWTGNQMTGAPTITLEAGKRKMKEMNTVRLKWREATLPDIDVYRDGTLIATTQNDGTDIDSTGDTGRARYTYQVCEAGTHVCSNELTVTFAH